MVRIVKTEFYKLKRYHILWAGVALMLLSVLLTLFTSMANDGSVWDFAYLTEQVIKNNMSMIFPMCISSVSYTHLDVYKRQLLQNAERNWNRQDNRKRQLPKHPKGRLLSMNALLLQSSRKISEIMQIPLMQESQLYSQLPHPSGNGDRFLMRGLWQNGLRFRW